MGGRHSNWERVPMRHPCETSGLTCLENKNISIKDVVFCIIYPLAAVLRTVVSENTYFEVTFFAKIHSAHRHRLRSNQQR